MKEQLRNLYIHNICLYTPYVHFILLALHPTFCTCFSAKYITLNICQPQSKPLTHAEVYVYTTQKPREFTATGDTCCKKTIQTSLPPTGRGQLFGCTRATRGCDEINRNTRDDQLISLTSNHPMADTCKHDIVRDAARAQVSGTISMHPLSTNSYSYQLQVG